MGKDDVNVPAGLQAVLKDFAKVAMRTQPDDLVEFGKEYFAAQALCDSTFGSEQATREDGERDLTMDLVWSIHRQFCTSNVWANIKMEDFLTKWRYLRLSQKVLDELLWSMEIKKDDEDIIYAKIMIGMCGYVRRNYLNVLKQLCELLANRKDGNKRIPCETFIGLYTAMLTAIFDGKEDEVNEFKGKSLGWLKKTYVGGYEGSGMIGPDEFTHPDAPPMFPRKWRDETSKD